MIGRESQAWKEIENFVWEIKSIDNDLREFLG